jgi:RNA polymerase sigma-54 factor
MSMEFRLNQGLSQTLSQKMTPRMQQAIKLLQYNHMELSSHIEQALLENPTLESRTSEDGASDGERKLEERTRKDAAEAQEQANGAGEDSFDWEAYLAQASDRPRLSSGPAGFDELPPIETNLTYARTLTEHLLDQLAMIRCHADEHRAAEIIVHNLNERGYLDVDVETLAEDLDFDLEVVEDGREIVMSLDPIGCGARDVSECLIAQARVVYREDPLFEPILRDHLDHLSRRNYGAIARALGIEEEDVIAYHEDIRRLEPYPGRNFAGGDARYITPDVYVFRVGDDWHIQLNEEGLPDLRVGRQYESLLRKGSKKDREYIKERLDSARFLIQSIDRRRKTIRRVMESILKFQLDFFEHGVHHLRPMILEDVARDIEVHMSTVSRVTSGKYAHTPHGIFELKFFFSNAVRQSGGDEDLSAESIKARLKQLLDGEDRRKPLSDAALEQQLKKEGIEVARRTVAKYREQLGYLSSKMRKELF